MQRGPGLLERLFERALWSSRLLMLVAVVSSVFLALGSFYLALVDLISFFGLIGGYGDLGTSVEQRDALRADAITAIVKVLDGFLIAAILIIVALGLYELRKENPKSQVLILSGSLNRKEYARAVEAGAAGVLDKVAGLEEIKDGVRRLVAGVPLLSQKEAVELLRHYLENRRRDHDAEVAVMSLTPREKEVLKAMAEGLSSEQVARQLFITTETGRTHTSKIFRKLSVRSRTEAVLFALRYGVAELE